MTSPDTTLAATGEAASDAVTGDIAIDLPISSEKDNVQSGSFVPIVRDDDLFSYLAVWAAKRAIRRFRAVAKPTHIGPTASRWMMVVM